MSNIILENIHAGTYTKHQQLFFRHTFMVFVDLTVLNLFNQFWDYVFIESFLISLLAAVLLQVMLKLTIAIEHYAAGYFKDKPGLKPKILRGLSAWAILFVSKLVILELINLSFGKSVLFSGPVHGLVAFLIVVMAIILTEQAFSRLYQSLG